MKWEYTVEVLDLTNHDVSFVSRLNELGKQGWELVSVVNTSGADALVAFLKREYAN